jgi:hypothetical protein
MFIRIREVLIAVDQIIYVKYESGVVVIGVRGGLTFKFIEDGIWEPLLKELMKLNRRG